MTDLPEALGFQALAFEMPFHFVIEAPSLWRKAGRSDLRDRVRGRLEVAFVDENWFRDVLVNRAVWSEPALMHWGAGAGAAVSGSGVLRAVILTSGLDPADPSAGDVFGQAQAVARSAVRSLQGLPGCMLAVVPLACDPDIPDINADLLAQHEGDRRNLLWEVFPV